MVGIAQLVSAPDCGSGGPGFESLYPPVFPWEAVPGLFVFYERVDVKFDREVKVETQIINGYYFTARYPGDESIEVTKEDLDVCADAVEHCRESILKMIQEIENELNENEES